MKLRQHWMQLRWSACWPTRPRPRGRLTPSYQCVPEETVLIVRVPEARKFIDALRSPNQVRLGRAESAASGSDQRLYPRASSRCVQRTRHRVGRYNLKLKILPPCSIRSWVRPGRRTAAGEYPLAVGLWWLEPNTDLGQRLLAAIQRGVDEQKDEQHATKRLDIDLEGTR